MVTMDAFASAFGFDAKSDDVWTTLGKVTAVGSGTLSVLLGGSATPMDCEAYCVAGVGDIVFVAITKGRARAIACKGVDAATWRSALGLGSMATEDAANFLPTSGGTLTGSLTVNTTSVTISDAGGWRSALGFGTMVQDFVSGKSTSNTTATKITSITLPAGTWLITGTVLFYTNSTGYRNVKISTTSADTSVSAYYSACVPAVSGTSTVVSRALIVQLSASTEYFLNSYQNSGGSLSVDGHIRAVRIG